LTVTLSLLRARSTLVWIVLVVATIVSWAVGSAHGTGSAVAVVVLAVAVVKVRFVGLDFMELRSAPLILRAMFEGYCVALWCVLVGMYIWL
jgi:Prokaryotic Cytochrome C oxidase subunit IV